MKRRKKTVLWMFLLAALMFLPAMSVQAKTSVTKAKSSSLKNVKSAGVQTGKWVRKQDRVFFKADSGELITDRWISLNGSIYYLDAQGCRAVGWISYNGERYFTRKGGKLHTGWLRLDGKRYYLKESNGRMAKGLCKIGENKYYFSPTGGAMKTGWKTIDQNRYYFNTKNGKMITSKWAQKDGISHYLNASGKMVKSAWLNYNDQKYYLDSKGVKVTGTAEIDGKICHFDEDGVYLPNRLGGIIDSSKPMVALTFDDGPGKYTGRLLDCLKKYNAKATFFMVGYCVPNYPDSVKRMAEYGCDLGSHSYDHPYFTRISSSARKSQISRTSENIKKACGQLPTLFRLPYGDGAFSKSVLSEIGLPSIFWSLGTHDFLHLSDPQFTVNEVLNNVKDGDIVLMHDSHYSSVVAAEKIIPALIKRGYQLVTVTELAEYKGKTTLTAGKTYSKF